MILTNPILDDNLIKTDQDHSRPSSQLNHKRPPSSSLSTEKIIDGDVVSSKSRRNSNISQQQQQPTITNEKSNHRESNSSEQIINKKDSRRSSTDNDISIRTSAKKNQERILSNTKRESSLKKHSDQTIITSIKTNSAKSQQKTEKVF